MRNPLIAALAAIAALTLLSGCPVQGIKSTAPCQAVQADSNDDVPEWVVNLPPEPGKQCAVGSAEPSYYANDAAKTAEANCRTELAKSICTEMRSASIDMHSSESGSHIERLEVAIVSDITVQAVKGMAEVSGTWYDKDGVASMRDKVTYVKCCVPKGAVSCEE